MEKVSSQKVSAKQKALVKETAKAKAVANETANTKAVANETAKAKAVANETANTKAVANETANTKAVANETPKAKTVEFEMTQVNCDGTDLAKQPITAEQKKKWLFKITPATITKTAMLTAISFLLYAFGKFNVPMIFPSFLEIQFSELPALLAGFSMGPLSGCVVIIAKCLLKFPMSSTGFVGELTDIVIGLCFVLPASLLYKYKKTRKSAVIGLGAGVLMVTLSSILINRFISIPFYVELFFKGNWNILLGVVRPLYANVTRANFYAYYLGLAVVPFNLLRGIITASLTFLLYKRLSSALHWEFQIKKEKNTICSENDSKNLNFSTENTYIEKNSEKLNFGAENADLKENNKENTN